MSAPKNNTAAPTAKAVTKPDPTSDQNCEFVYLSDKPGANPRALTLDQLVAENTSTDVDMDSFDLYGDLDESLQSVREKELQKKLAESRDVITTLQNEKAEVNRKVNQSSGIYGAVYVRLPYCPMLSHLLLFPITQLMALVRQNATLLKNISSLFRTAQAELARKDRFIGELRQDVEKKDRMIKEFTPSGSVVVSPYDVGTSSAQSNSNVGLTQNPQDSASRYPSSTGLYGPKHVNPQTHQDMRKHTGNENVTNPQRSNFSPHHHNSRESGRNELTRDEGYDYRDREYRRETIRDVHKPR